MPSEAAHQLNNQGRRLLDQAGRVKITKQECPLMICKAKSRPTNHPFLPSIVNLDTEFRALNDRSRFVTLFTKTEDFLNVLNQN